MDDATLIDRAKNRITIRFRGRMTVEEAEALRDAYRAAIAQMEPGFTTLTLAEEYVPGSAEVQEIVASMTKMAGDAGIKKVARVVGAKPLGGMQIDRLAKQVTSFPSKHFATRAEAEAYLDAEE